ncbi:MAG: hypothetical protein IPL40_12175 [Proteobacteria bacterium]|nr:hypothetical protein [Pseudomonadota bacterium]
MKQARGALEQAYRAALAQPTTSTILRARLQQRLRRLLTAASRPSTRIVVGATAGPLDDAEDLETKADLLRDSADKVERQLRTVRTQIAVLEQRTRLQRHQVAANADLFIEEAPRWVAQARSAVSATSVAADTSPRRDPVSAPREVVPDGVGASSEASPTPRGPISVTTSVPGDAPSASNAPASGLGSSGTDLQSGGMQAASGSGSDRAGGVAQSDPGAGASPGDATSTAPSSAFSGSGPVTTTTTTVTLASVLDPGTVRALQQAARSGNPSAHAAALRQAAERLEQLARRLSAQAQGLRRDAIRERAQH